MKSTKASIVICSWPVPSLEWVSPAISSWTKKCLTPSFLSHRQVVEPLPDPHRRAGKLIRCNAVVLDPAGSPAVSYINATLAHAQKQTLGGEEDNAGWWGSLGDSPASLASLIGRWGVGVGARCLWRGVGLYVRVARSGPRSRLRERAMTSSISTRTNRSTEY